MATTASAYTPEEVVAALRKLSNANRYLKQLRKAYRKVGTRAAEIARADLRSRSPQIARAARAVRGTSSATSASMSVGGRAVGGALAAVYGRKGPSGWAAGWRSKPEANAVPARTRDGRTGYVNPNRAAGFRDVRNNPPWVTNTWKVGVRNTGPRGLNNAVAPPYGYEHAQAFAQAGLDTIAEAFPRGLR